MIQRLQDLPGQRLFQFETADGAVHDVESSDINAYLREISGADFTAKDFRTWAGTMLAAIALREMEAFDTEAQGRKKHRRRDRAYRGSARQYAAICRKCYVHPHIFDAYLDGALASVLESRAEEQIRHSLSKLRPEEAAILGLLQQRLRKSAGVKRK